jgi:hypothetical protein
VSVGVLAIVSVIVSLAVSPTTAAVASEPSAEPLKSVWSPPDDAAGLSVPEDRQIPEDSWAPLPEDRFSAGGSQMRAPAGTVASVPGLGEQPWFSFQDFPVSPDTTVRVNTANGNLVVKASDSAIAVPGSGCGRTGTTTGSPL